MLIHCHLNPIGYTEVKFWSKYNNYTHAPPKVEWDILDSPRCLSVRPSVCRQLGFRNFLKKLLAPFITLMGWVSWPLFIFVFLASFLALWWPNIWPKMGFPEFFEKTIGPIHYISGIYPYWVSLLTPIHFRVPSLIFGPLVAKYLAGNGVSRTFWKKYWLNSFHTWHLPLWGESFEPYTFSCSWPQFLKNYHLCSTRLQNRNFWMRWVVIRAGVYCPHLWAQLVSIKKIIWRYCMQNGFHLASASIC